jgi:hypothetical protein
MKFGVHSKNEEGEIGERLHDELFDTHEEAAVWMLEAMRKEEVELDGCTIEHYTDEGEHVEVVEDEEAEKAGDEASALVEDNEDVRGAFATMLAGRRMYAMAVQELERVLDGLKKDPHPLVMEVLLQTAANEASKPFNEAELFQGLTSLVFPWMQEIVAKHTEEDNIAQQQYMNELEEQRRKSKVYISVVMDKTLEPYLDRAQPLVFVGYRPAVRVLIDHIVTQVLAHIAEGHPRLYTVIRMSEQQKREDAHERLMRLPKDLWKNVADKSDSIAKMMGKVWDQLPDMPDVLVCDDLPYAYEGLSISTDASRSAEAVRRMKQWCKEAGCGLIGSIPMSGESVPNTMGSVWDRLKAHVTLRPVSVLRVGDKDAEDLEEGKCRIVIGRDAFKMDVDEALLAYGGNIIVP